MVQHLYKSFLADEAEYQAAEARWRQLWDRIIADVKPEAEWKVPWFATEFANGTPMRDGNPIFSAVAPALRRGVRIIQHEPTSNEIELEYWQDTFDGDEPIAELVISCALSQQVEDQAADVLGKWMTIGNVDGKGIHRLGAESPQQRSVKNPAKSLAPNGLKSSASSSIGGNSMIPIAAYWQAVAKAIDAENEKLGLFITHPVGLGTGREAILRHFLVTHTPEPFRIETGFISRLLAKVGAPQPDDIWTSMQCDLLIYNPQVAQPYYAIENLAVVPREAAAAVVEVKSDLGPKTFEHMLELWENLHWLPVNLLGFAYDGWTFETFIDHLRNAISDRKFGVPGCIAVHKKNYIFIRSEYRLAPTSNRHRPARYQLAVNFEGASNDGLASGCFLDTFLRELPPMGRQISLDSYLPQWFNQLPLPKAAKIIIADDGTVSEGLLPT